jgi:hypothetical protein
MIIKPGQSETHIWRALKIHPLRILAKAEIYEALEKPGFLLPQE